MTEPLVPDDVLNPAEAARYIGVGLPTLYEYAARGLIKPLPKRAGDSKPEGETPEWWRRKMLFRRKNLDAFIERHVQKARPGS